MPDAPPGFFRRLVKAVLSALAVLVIPVLGRPEMLRSSQLWVLVVFGVAAMLLQPEFSFFGSRGPYDRGTMSAIGLSCALLQTAALIEAVYFRYPAGVRWDAVSIGALGAMLSGLALRTWAIVTLGRYFTMHVDLQQGQTIVRAGPYRVLRHPSYTGALLIYASAPLLLHAYCSAALAFVVLPIVFIRRIRVEEAVLRSALPGYEQYAREVKALVPALY